MSIWGEVHLRSWIVLPQANVYGPFRLNRYRVKEHFISRRATKTGKVNVKVDIPCKKIIQHVGIRLDGRSAFGSGVEEK